MMRDASGAALPDCLSAQDVRDVGQLRAAVAGHRREVKRRLEEALMSTIVEVPLPILAELLDLAAEAQEARERKAARKPGQRPSTNLSATPEQKAQAIALLNQGLDRAAVVQQTGLSAQAVGIIAHHTQKGTSR